MPRCRQFVTVHVICRRLSGENAVVNERLVQKSPRRVSELQDPLHSRLALSYMPMIYTGKGVGGQPCGKFAALSVDLRVRLAIGLARLTQLNGFGVLAFPRRLRRAALEQHRPLRLEQIYYSGRANINHGFKISSLATSAFRNSFCCTGVAFQVELIQERKPSDELKNSSCPS
jgi:hypothetical protein